jgi:hypothetical protein
MIGDDEIEDFIATLSECAESRIKGAKGSNQTLAESSVVVKEIMAINTVFLGWKVASLHEGEDEKMREEEKEDTLALEGDDSDGEETDAGNVVVSIRDR